MPMNEHRRRRPADPERTEILPDRSRWPMWLALVLIVAFFAAIGYALATDDDRGQVPSVDLRPGDAGLVCGEGTHRQVIYGHGYDLPDECRPGPEPATGGDR